MRYCKKCGNQLSDDMLFCQKCGTKVEAAAKDERPTAAYPVLEDVKIPSTKKSKQEKQRTKNKIGFCFVGIILLALIAIFIIATIDSNNNGNSDDPPPSTSTNAPVSSSKNTVVLDVEKYGNISADELVALVGEPDEISQSTCQGAFEIPCVYYEYSNAGTLGEVSFVLVNDQVVRFTSYSEYPYESKDAVLAQFGITKESSCAVAANTNVALRYRCPSAKVDDFWINLIDGDTFEFLQITYDMEYYEEWYLPLTSSEEIEYKTDAELTMKSLLTSPKTADFPWYDWEYGKNLFYILVSSYVDAENAFGVEMRNTFTFVYSRLTGEIVLAIVNDEVVANNGYVAVDELIQQLYDEMKKAVAENFNADKGTESAPADNETSEAGDSTPTSNPLPPSTTTPTQETSPTTTPTPSENTEPEQETNSISDLEYVIYNVCEQYNSGDTPYSGQLYGTVNSATSVTVEHYVRELIPASEEYKLYQMEDALVRTFSETLSEVFPQSIEIYVYTTATIIDDADSGNDDESGDLDGIVTEDPVDTTPTASEWISAEQLKSNYDLSYWWNGEEIQLYDSSNRYIISGSPKSSFEKDKIYTGSCNGVSVRFKYSQVTSSNSGNTFFYYDDLVAAGII